MKITFLTPALVAILGLAFVNLNAQADTTSTNAPSATPTTPTTATTSTKASKTPYKGIITAISATSVTISGKTPMTLAIDATTKFEVSHKKATAADFAVGDKITGSYLKDDSGTMTAASIHKKTAK
jgi:hypothetical protein